MATIPFKLPNRPKLAQIRLDEIRGHSEEFKTGWNKRKESAKGSIASLFKTGRTSRRAEDEPEEERLGPRPVSRRTKSTPAKSSVPGLDISDDVLDRLTSEPAVARRPTSKFLANQRQRAGLTTSPPSSSQAELDRRPLEAEDVMYMFAGCPYYDVEDCDGHLRPKVTLRGTPPDHTDIDDDKDFKHKSFRSCSIHGEGPPRKRNRQTLQEVPSMRSANGKDPGAIGITHFLELPLQQTNLSDDNARIHQQQTIAFDPESLGLREFDIENVIDRLVELAKVDEMLRDGKGEATEWDQRMIEDIGEDLFSTLLSAELGTTQAGTGDVSLPTQISALQKVLNAPHLWPDFSDGDWRMRLGQLLWEPNGLTTGSEDVPAINERDVLMLQIALGAELAVRLEIAHRLAESDIESIGIFTLTDLDRVLESQSLKLDWDVLLFHRFVECFEATSRLQAAARPLPRLSLIGTEASAPAEEDDDDDDEPDLVFELRKESEQFDGLHTFAKELGWPDLKNTKATPALPKFDSFLTPPIAERPVSVASEYDTPMTSPALPPLPEKTPALVLLRKAKSLIPHSAFDDLNNAISGGSLSWIAKSWLSGFIMPGFTANLSLMLTLLETSPGTKNLLSEALSMNDGFVHKKQMYWAKDSVVGRVLAPAADAKECMGWISLPFVPQGGSDGWIQALVRDAPYALMEPRINAPALIARSSDPLRGNDASTLQAGDYVNLDDGHLTLGNEAQFDGVSLTSSKVVNHTEDGFWMPKIINMTFRSPRNQKLRPLTLPLTHAVYFVSSYPCYPQQRLTKTAARDSFVPTDSGESTPMSAFQNKDLPLPPAHPLHIESTYTIIPAAALLSSALPEVKDSDSLVLIDSPIEKPSIYQIEDQEVVVLDCRGSSDLEVLARAWCAKVGENAVIGKKGRTCLACCIREAVGLGIGVVIRTS